MSEPNNAKVGRQYPPKPRSGGKSDGAAAAIGSRNGAVSRSGNKAAGVDEHLAAVDSEIAALLDEKSWRSVRLGWLWYCEVQPDLIFGGADTPEGAVERTREKLRKLIK